MRARDRAEGENDRNQRASGRNCICKQCDRSVSAVETLRHDTGADDRSEQQRGADGFGGRAAREVHLEQQVVSLLSCSGVSAMTKYVSQRRPSGSVAQTLF